MPSVRIQKDQFHQNSIWLLVVVCLSKISVLYVYVYAKSSETANSSLTSYRLFGITVCMTLEPKVAYLLHQFDEDRWNHVVRDVHTMWYKCPIHDVSNNKSCSKAETSHNVTAWPFWMKKYGKIFSFKKFTYLVNIGCCDDLLAANPFTLISLYHYSEPELLTTRSKDWTTAIDELSTSLWFYWE